MSSLPFTPPELSREDVVIRYLATWGGEWVAHPARASMPTIRVFYDKKYKRSVEFNMAWMDEKDGMFGWKKMIDKRVTRTYA